MELRDFWNCARTGTPSGTQQGGITRPAMKGGETHNIRAAAPITLEVLVRDAANLLTLD